MPVDHYENFPVASWLLPRRLRRPIELIYAFARRADDFADEGSLSVTERLAALNQFGQQLDAIENGSAPTMPLFADLAQEIAAHDLPIGLFRDLLSAFRQDVTCQQYADFAALRDYCRRSADPIGRLLLRLYRADTPDNLRRSDAICTALQLINHWQDVAIDWRKNDTGRVYLPQDELARFGLSNDDIAAFAAQPINDAWSRMMAFQTSRARQLMRDGAPLALALPGRIGAELRLVVCGGLAILDKIEAVRGDVFRHRPALTRWDWIRMAPRALPLFFPPR